MPDRRRGPRVFSIAAGAPFLPTLAEAILAGDLVDLPRGDPLALADLTVLLPTRRAVRAFRDEFAARLGGAATILPAIRTIGDVDEEEHLLAGPSGAQDDLLVLPPAISRLARHLALTRLTLAWGRTVRREVLKLGPGETPLIPASAADATRLAADLARLFDDFDIAGKSLSAIAGLVPDDATGYFRITLEFLGIVSEQWPQFLAENGLADPAARRNALLDAEAARIRDMPAGRPIVAAGSTGSIPATARLLAAIAGKPDGAVVLPGLDMEIDDATFAAVDDTVGHPQHGMRRLVGSLGIDRDAVRTLGAPAPPVAARMRVLAEAMRPAETVDAWAGFRRAGFGGIDHGQAFGAVGLVVARNEREEALAIALAIREALEEPSATVALVTPDRPLARRVAVELGRWSLAVDDSAGTPLGRLPPGAFAMLLLELAASGGDAVSLLALLDHPLAAFGRAPARCRAAARVLEIGLLRGNLVAGGLGTLGPALARARAEAIDPRSRHVPQARRRLTQADWDEAEALVASLASALAPLEDVLGETQLPASRLAEALLAGLRQAAAGEAGEDGALWRGEGGAALAELLSSVRDQGAGLAIDGREAPAFVAALMGEISVARPVRDARVNIWGALEARLQSADLVILGGLDEGVWPAATRTDPWLSRTMRSELGLEAPERRIGLAAQDFTQGFGARRLLLTRAEKRGGSPTVASRWLLRLAALLGKDADDRMKARGAVWRDLARDLDRVDRGGVAPAPRPAPRPPVASRPRRLSVTEIETLIRDPYAIYARHVLGLQPLDPLGMAPDYALRGTVIHEALGRFAAEWAGAFDAAAEARLLAVGRETLAAIADFPDVHAVWSHRFAAVARWYVAWERERDPAIARRFAEKPGRWPLDIPGGFEIRGRADRIDLRRDGGLDVLDFKTGSPPSARQVLTGFAPQLAIEAAMARSGAFGDEFRGRPVAELGWLALGQVARGKVFRNAVEGATTADDLGREAEARLKALLAAYDGEERAYLSRARPMFVGRYDGDYDHLARVREWSLAESPEDAS